MKLSQLSSCGCNTLITKEKHWIPRNYPWTSPIKELGNDSSDLHIYSCNIMRLQALVIPECCYRGSRNLLMAEFCG